MNTSDTNQNKELGQLTPDMAGYRPAREWWPDLTNHRKIMLLHGITTEQIDKLLKEYADICCDVKKVPAAFYYAHLPEHPEWVCVEFPNFEKIHHAQNFETYQNLLLWVSDQSDREFCLALPEQQNGPLFFSTVDRKNPYRDSTVGIYADRDFYFTVPGGIFEWGPVPERGFPYAGYMQSVLGFDTKLLAETGRCAWEKTEVVLNFGEE